ncbi:MAG: UDP-N-acetylmuramate dehydrogenase [Candidatus Marinimicrobia bacterium]|nr:UDP-N-acetylmuramate dehydrogenase [Candidatus Neomarinimicrobiota bacterium]
MQPLTDLDFEALENSISGELKRNELMSKHTTYQIGGPAYLYALPKNRNDLEILIEFSRENEIPRFNMGGGSNILVHDKGIKAMVIDLKAGFSSIEVLGTTVTAQSGISLAKFVSTCRKNNLAGVEKLAGIPGSLGGALFMNAGAFGSEISQKLKSLTLLLEDGEFTELRAIDLQFGYRESNLPEGSLILEAEFELEKVEDASEIYGESKRIIKSRNEKQPVSVPSTGSIFKNPPEGDSAGKLIEDAGLKGTKAGGAMISEKHGNFILNMGNARAEDVVHLVALAHKTVLDKFNVELELELKLVGYDDWFI